MNKSEIDIEEINRLFQADPSLENYLELRRISPFVAGTKDNNGNSRTLQAAFVFVHTLKKEKVCK